MKRKEYSKSTKQEIKMNITNPTDMSSEVTLTEEQEIYKENIIDHYKHPHNKRKMHDPDKTEKGINPLCGDHIVLYLKLDKNKIVDVSFEGDGCAISMASISLLSDELIGKSITQAQKITKQEVYSFLGIPISHTRTKCALLSLNTLHKSLGSK